MLSHGEADRARDLASNAWHRSPDTAFDRVVALICRALAIHAGWRPESASPREQRRYFEAVRIAAGVRIALLGGGADLRELRRLEADVNGACG